MEIKNIDTDDVLEINIVIKGIAIVRSTANKSSCNSFSDRMRHIMANKAPC